MNLTKRGHLAIVVAFLLSVLALPATARADTSTTVFTTLIVQVRDQPPNAQVVVSASKQKQPTAKLQLDANLASIPPRARLKSCALRLVTSSGMPQTKDNGILLELFDAPENRPPIGARSINSGTPEKSAIVVESSGLCRSLTEARLNVERTDHLRLQTTTRNASITFFGRPEQASSEAPRLLLSYELPESWPGRADWSQARRDAQHSGRSAWRIYNPNGRFTPTRFKFRNLGVAAQAEVSPPLLLYGRSVLAVSKKIKDAIQIMDEDGTIVRQLQLNVKPKFIAVSQYGWLYDTGEDELDVQNIESETRVTIKINTDETVLVPPTIGADGSVYIVTNKDIYAYPPPPGSRVPLWRYRTGSGANNNVSAVALSEDGRTAYFVDKQKAEMIALDAATGALKWEQKGLPINRPINDPMPIPVVAGRAVFVTNKAPTGNALYIVKDNGESPVLETHSGSDITAPIVGPGESSVYYIADGILQRSWQDPADKRFKARPVDGKNCDKLRGVDLLRADGSGDMYAVDRAAMSFVFVSSDSSSLPAGQCQSSRINANRVVSLALAPDGTAYGYDLGSKRIQAITPVADAFGNGNILNLTNEILELSPDKKALRKNNDTTFRAGETVEMAAGLTLPPDTNINVVAGKKIIFGPGVRIVEGARLHARVGF